VCVTVPVRGDIFALVFGFICARFSLGIDGARSRCKLKMGVETFRDFDMS